jgi:hypothetical protein
MSLIRRTCIEGLATIRSLQRVEAADDRAKVTAAARSCVTMAAVAHGCAALLPLVTASIACGRACMSSTWGCSPRTSDAGAPCWTSSARPRRSKRPRVTTGGREPCGRCVRAGRHDRSAAAAVPAVQTTCRWRVAGSAGVQHGRTGGCEGQAAARHAQVLRGVLGQRAPAAGRATGRVWVEPLARF